jgi:hypothetical protein
VQNPSPVLHKLFNISKLYSQLFEWEKDVHPSKDADTGGTTKNRGSELISLEHFQQILSHQTAAPSSSFNLFPWHLPSHAALQTPGLGNSMPATPDSPPAILILTTFTGSCRGQEQSARKIRCKRIRVALAPGQTHAAIGCSQKDQRERMVQFVGGKKEPCGDLAGRELGGVRGGTDANVRWR